MAVRKRCVRCRQVVREDGTCQNEKCVLYVPVVVEETVDDKQEEEGEREA